MMDKNLLRNSPITLTILVGLGALLLTVVIGLFVLDGGLFKTLMHASAGKAPMEAIPCCNLLLAVLAALVVIAVLLLLLLLRCCRGGNKNLPKELSALLAFLPQLTQIPRAVRNSATALDQTSAALGAIQERLEAAGALLNGLYSAFDLPAPPNGGQFPVPLITTGDVVVPKFDLPGSQTIKVINGIDFRNTVKLASVKSALVDAGGYLQNPSVPFGQAGNTIGQVRHDLKVAADVLDTIATSLGA